MVQYLLAIFIIKLRLEMVLDPKKEDAPGDFVVEVRLVWTKIAPSIEKVFVVDKCFQFAGDLAFLVQCIETQRDF